MNNQESGMFKHSIIIAIVLSTVSGVVLAQTTTPPPPTTTAPMPGTTAPATTMGMRTADTATLAVRFVTVKPADFMASKLIGTNVYNNQSDKLGEIEDLVVENGKSITGVVVSVGGFLGVGESYVVIDPSTVMLNQKDGTWRAYVDTSKDTLKNAPKFTYTKKKS
jgi:sporulation protein YlmC with PRC-barrel domain